MKVNDQNLSSLASTGGAAASGGAAGVQGTSRTSNSSAVAEPNSAASSDGVHLSELVRSLQALAVDSPQHQARIEQIARSAANGSYKVDAPATATKIVDDALYRH
jgi:anti-sigma28 factor (negative regulator of flagellin synthesis)